MCRVRFVEIGTNTAKKLFLRYHNDYRKSAGAADMNVLVSFVADDVTIQCCRVKVWRRKREEETEIKGERGRVGDRETSRVGEWGGRVFFPIDSFIVRAQPQVFVTYF